MIKRLNESSYKYTDEENLRYLRKYRKYIEASRKVTDEIESMYDDVMDFCETNYDNSYFAERIAYMYTHLGEGFGKLLDCYYDCCEILDAPKKDMLRP